MKYNNTINIIILSIILSIIIALIPYFILIHFVVDANLPKINIEFDRAKNIQTFYEKNHTGDIFIVGSSLVNEGIDGYIVEDILHKNLINRSVYSLGENSFSPPEMLVTLNNLIASKPGVVVIGLFCCGLQAEPLNDRFAMMKPISNEYKFLFNYEQLKQQSPFERLFYERKYLKEYFKLYLLQPSLKSKNSTGAIPRSQSYVSNFKDPWVKTVNLTEVEKSKLVEESVEKSKELNKKQPSFTFEELFHNDSLNSNQHKIALQYIIDKLRQNNIGVIIINMPLSPDRSNLESESSRNDLLKFLNSTGVVWYDYEREYPPEYFTDLTHLNIAGRNDFSPKIAQVLIDYFMKGGKNAI